ncbi:MAG: peptidylprolyl isomerase, partial [Chloroflexi bacterium]|nr:peptidylprolyl isomerase [Chloroflexota bacterium]
PNPLTTQLPNHPTSQPPVTPTPALAAIVNGEGISLSDYEQEVARYELAQATLGLDPGKQGDYRAQVLDTLIEQKVVEQAAALAGFTVSEAEAQAELERVKQETGGEEAFNNWLLANLYTADQFLAALKAQMLTAGLTEQIAASVPAADEQVHARHILVAGEAEAQALLAELQSGADFGELALANSLDLSTRPAGGDLGWFPRGALTAPEVEDAAFNLQPNELSGVIHSALGYHLVQTLERDPARELSPEALQLRRQQAVEAWVQEQVADADIQRLIAP